MQDPCPVMRDDLYVLNHCTTYLARQNADQRHNFGFGHYADGDPRGRIREPWRFPIVDTCADPPDGADRADLNDITFVYCAVTTSPSVAVTGTFTNIYDPIPLRCVRFLDEDTIYYAVTVPVLRQQVFRYKFIVDGEIQLDPINPQTTRLDNGILWSRFFTWECTQPIVFERWELTLVARLCNHILPFRTREGQRFLSHFYEGLDTEARLGLQRRAYRLDDSAGAAMYIDHILAREESHHLVDYRKCLRQLDRILRQRDPNHEPGDASKDLYINLYEELAANQVNGWDVSDYGRPRHFLDLLRRHAFTGAFAHPKYGGNVAATGWAYLEQELTSGGVSIFDWGQSLEQPLGRSSSYLG